MARSRMPTTELLTNPELDQRILECLDGRQLRFAEIVARIYRASGSYGEADKPYWRHVDRRLQALKRTGKIRHNKSISRWEKL